MKKSPPIPKHYIDSHEALRAAKKIWMAGGNDAPRVYFIDPWNFHKGWVLRPWDGALFDNYWDAWAYHLKLKLWRKENDQ